MWGLLPLFGFPKKGIFPRRTKKDDKYSFIAIIYWWSTQLPFNKKRIEEEKIRKQKEEEEKIRRKKDLELKEFVDELGLANLLLIDNFV